MLRVLIVSVNTLLSWIMKAVLIGLFFFAIFTPLNFIIIFSIVVALIFSFLPAIVNRSYKTNLPWVVDFLVTLTVFLHTIGIVFNLYHHPDWEWWDVVVHSLSTAVIAMLAFFAVFTLNYVKKTRMSIPMIGFFTFALALSIGAMWEILEFYSDLLINTQSVRGIEDTISDLVFDMIGGGVAALFGMLYVKRQKHRDLSRTLRPIAKIFIGK